MKNINRILCLLLSLVMILAMFAGCSNQEASTEATGESQSSAETEAQTEEESGISFPLEETVTLTIWCPINLQASAIMDDYNGSLVFQEMEERTNVHIEFIHPASGQESEQFNLMIASGEYPDMIMGGISRYVGGGDVAIEDGVFLKLNDLIAEYAPNYTALLETDEEAARQTITDEGNMTAIWPIMRVDNLCWYGPVLNKEWLDETGMDVPETLAEWEAVLTAMKENHPDGTPLVFATNNGTATSGFRARGYDTWGIFMSAFGLGCSASYDLLYNDDGTIKHTATQPEFKEYLEMMNRWYENGLIDLDFPARDNDGVNALVTSNQVGAYVGTLEAAATLFTSQGMDYVAAPYPVMNEGDPVHLRSYDEVASPAASSVSITTACEYPEIAVAWLDYAPHHLSGPPVQRLYFPGAS